MMFLFIVNVYVFIPMVLFLWLKIDKMGFLFSVDVYVFIAMVVFLWLKIDKNCQKLSKMGIHENE